MGPAPVSRLDAKPHVEGLAVGINLAIEDGWIAESGVSLAKIDEELCSKLRTSDAIS